MKKTGQGLEERIVRSRFGAAPVVWLGVFFSSLSVVLVRMSTAPSMVMAGFRMVFASLLLVPSVMMNNRTELRQMGSRQILWCLLGGAFFGLDIFTYFVAVNTTTITAAQVLAGSEVVYVALFMMSSGRERYPVPALAGIAAAIGGGVLVAYTGAHATAQTTLSGNLIALLSGFFTAGYSLVGMHVRNGFGCSNTLYTMQVYGFAGLVLMILIRFSGYSYLGYGWQNYLIALGMAVFCNLLGHSLINWTLKYLSPTLVAMIRIFQPVFCTMWGVLCFAEIPGWNQILGGAVVIFGIFLYTAQKAY